MSIQRLLDNVTDPDSNAETLDGDNCLCCDHCRSRTPTLLSTRILQRDAAEAGGDGVPHFLTLQLNRFQYNRQRFSYEKVLDPVWLDEVVSLAVFRPADAPGGEPANADDDDEEDDEEGGGGGGRSSQRLSAYTRRERALFRLKACIVHSGSTPMSGHYFTLAKAHSACLTEDERRREREEVSAYVRGFFGGGGGGGGGGPRRSADEEGEGEGEGMPLRITSDFYSHWVMLNDSNVRKVKAEVVEGVLAGRCGIFSHLDTPYVLLYERIADVNNYAVAVSSPRIAPPSGHGEREWEEREEEAHVSDSLWLPLTLPASLESELLSRVDPHGSRADAAAVNRFSGPNGDGGGGDDDGGGGGGGYGQQSYGGGFDFTFGGGYIPP